MLVRSTHLLNTQHARHLHISPEAAAAISHVVNNEQPDNDIIGTMSNQIHGNTDSLTSDNLNNSQLLQVNGGSGANAGTSSLITSLSLSSFLTWLDSGLSASQWRLLYDGLVQLELFVVVMAMLLLVNYQNKIGDRVSRIQRDNRRNSNTNSSSSSNSSGNTAAAGNGNSADINPQTLKQNQSSSTNALTASNLDDHFGNLNLQKQENSQFFNIGTKSSCGGGLLGGEQNQEGLITSDSTAINSSSSSSSSSKESDNIMNLNTCSNSNSNNLLNGPCPGTVLPNIPINLTQSMQRWREKNNETFQKSLINSQQFFNGTIGRFGVALNTSAEPSEIEVDLNEINTAKTVTNGNGNGPSLNTVTVSNGPGVDHGKNQKFVDGDNINDTHLNNDIEIDIDGPGDSATKGKTNMITGELQQQYQQQSSGTVVTELLTQFKNDLKDEMHHMMSQSMSMQQKNQMNFINNMQQQQQCDKGEVGGTGMMNDDGGNTGGSVSARDN